MASQSKGKYLNFLKTEVRSWVRMRVHIQEQDLRRWNLLPLTMGGRLRLSNHFGWMWVKAKRGQVRIFKAVAINHQKLKTET